MEPVVVWARKFRSVRYGAVERDGAGLGLAGDSQKRRLAACATGSVLVQLGVFGFGCF